MHNRPLPVLSEPVSVQRRSIGPLTVRLVGLFLLLSAMLIGTAARLVYVQTRLADRYLAEIDKTSERFESIPARAARILSADGTVLAEDVEIHTLKAQYRWLEEPADPQWLKQMALSRLPKSERRQAGKIKAQIEQIERERVHLWDLLAERTGHSPAELRRLRRTIQLRVERMREQILQKQTEALAANDLARDASRMAAEAATTNADWAGRWWSRTVRELMSPPEREEIEPITLQEERDYHLILGEIAPDLAIEIEAHPERYPGIRTELSTRRLYPQGSIAAHLIGYRTPLTPEELDDRQARTPEGDPLDYQAGDRIGRTGIERSYDRQLRGLRGQRKIVTNRRGEIVSSEVVREPRPGQDVILSMQLPLQRKAEQLLDRSLSALSGPALTDSNHDANPHPSEENDRSNESTSEPRVIPSGGALIAIDVRTGAVLAAASAPRFDLRTMIEIDTESWQLWQSDARKPLFHRATEMTLPPGSVFKIVTAIGLLEAGAIHPEEPFDCRGYLDTPDRHRCIVFRHAGVGHGPTDLTMALARSCNVYFFDAARRSGPLPITTWASRLGFGQPTGIDLPGEMSGLLPKPSLAGGARRGNDQRTLGLAIGQDRLLATPMQIARMMAAVANGGRMVRPHLMETIGIASAESDGLPVNQGSVAAGSQANQLDGLSPATLAWIGRGLNAVVSDPRGTAYKSVRLPNVAIAGKTGTAEAGGGKPDHAWFAGYAPADQPRVAFVVVLEHGGSGGHAAGPIAREFVQELIASGVIRERRLLSAQVAD